MLFTEPPWIEPRTAYVHIPFCAHHCGYCDFAVTAGQDHLIDSYLTALEVELTSLGGPKTVESLFIGGGTPTQLSPRQLERLLTLLRRWFVFASVGYEFTVESNPDNVTAERVEVLADHGVNRLSIGVQSFQPHLLTALERNHRTDHIPRAVEVARQRIRNLSFDLIFATPGQTLEDWAGDLAEAVQHGPEHVSTYNLTYEKGTSLWKAMKLGELKLVHEESELAMYVSAIDELARHGFEHYEISNFARPGRRSKHNQRYWANEAYWGFGVGAARYVGGRREVNVRDTKLYIHRVLKGESPTQSSESLSPRDRAVETMAVQLRRSDGVHRGQFREQTGFQLDDITGTRLKGFVVESLLVDDAESVRLTSQGKCVADGVIAKLMQG